MRFIDPRGKALGHLDRIVDWNRGEKPAPVTVEWDLSNRCVLGCQSCHFAHTHTRGPWAVKDRVLPMAYDACGDLAETYVVMRGLSQMSEAGVEGVVWSGGGEPTTHPQWRAIVAHARDCGIEQGMYTLGGLISEDDAKLMAECLTWAVVSLDCPDADTYAKEKGVPLERFTAACQGVQRLAQAGATVGVSFLLHAGNWAEAKRMLSLGRFLGATYVTFRPTIETSPDRPSVAGERGWITDALPMLQHLAEQPDVEMDVDRFLQYRDWSGHGYTACQGVRLNATVTQDGRVWMCPQRRGVGVPLGDLREESFADIWSRHPGAFTVDEGCRVMCRLHPVNTTLHELSQPRKHGAFV